MAEEEQMLKILSSETRREIIRELSNGYRTPSDLSKILGKSKSTTVEHLEKLQNAGLVSKSPHPGGKWIFYRLTRKGESLVPRKSKRIVFVLALVFLTFSVGLYSMYNYYTNPLVLRETTTHEGDYVVKSIEPWAGSNADIGQDEDVIESRNQLYLAIAVLMFIFSFLGLVLIFVDSRKQRKPEV